MTDSRRRASYQQGDWVSVAADGSWLLIDLPPSHDTVRACWRLVSDDRSADDVLDAIVSGGIGSAPSFAFVRLSDGERRMIVRGAASIATTAEVHDSATVSATPGTAWSDQLVGDDVTELLLNGSQGSVPDVSMPMSAGVTMAGSVRIELRVSAAAVSDDASPVGLRPEAESLAQQAPDSADADAVAAAAVESTAVAEPESQESNVVPSYDFLFGATQGPLRDVEATAGQSHGDGAPEDQVGPGSDAAEDGQGLAPQPSTVSHETAGWATLPPPAPAPRNDAPPQDVPDAATPLQGSGLIDAVPWAAPPLPATPPSAAPSTQMPPASATPMQPPSPAQQLASEQDEVGKTTDRARLLAQVEAGISGPTVLAVYCPSGHLTPAHAPTCRICRVPVAQQQGFETARPGLGVLRMSTGDVVALDRGVIMGRAPDVNAADERDRPNVLRLASPDNDISRNHAEVVLDGWQVYIRDLGSTNGTVVTLPGQPPNRLRRDDMFPIEPGTTVSLADEVSFTFEVTA